MIKSVSKIISVLFLAMLITACPPDRGTGRPVIPVVSESQHFQTVNFYIESSGSMVGYFNGNSQIKEIIKQYYDRISEDKNVSDTTTLNFINQSVEEYPDDISNYLSNATKKCTASYTKIDEILSKAMEGINDSVTNILISDYCFTSDKGSFQTAESGITKIFTENIARNNNLSIAIYKFMSDFNGKYYPGGIKCTQPRPFYLWIFGTNNQIKKIANLNIKNTHYGSLLLQPKGDVRYGIKTDNARMLDKDSSIRVEYWDRDRNSTRGEITYSFEIVADMSNIILPSEDLLNIDNYSVNAGYHIESINNSESLYVYKITTRKPSPGNVVISYDMPILPKWVEESNYEGSGLPIDSTTLGVKYLIEGVYDAYKNKKNNNFFQINIVLK